ncbi:MAG: protein kinase [Planctomycetota bacterium]|nr:protein kinase [Planctomycetota bacterium]
MVDERSDIYSLGAVLYEIVTGEAPYQGKTAKQVLSSVLSEEPRRIPDVSPDAPPELAALVMRALQRNPDDRFQSARDLADEVQAFRDGRMVSTYRYSAFELLTRFVARNRAAVAVTVLALLVLVAGGVYAYGNVKRERDSALAAQADALAQRGIAESQAREAERQKGIAQDQAQEAERQKGIAKERADDADAQKRVAVQKAAEAELERGRADAQADEARRSEERATRALEQARRNLAQAHLGYAQLADERGQTGEHLLHLAAAHRADADVVDATRLVSTLNEAAFPVWSTRSYVDLPAGPAVFSRDRRLCAAPMHKPPRALDEFTASADNTALPDVGIWDVATGTLLRRISTEVYQERRLLFSGDGTRLVALEEGGTIRIWSVADGVELSARAAHPWGYPPLLAPGPDGDTFFTAGSDGKVWEWHAADGSAGRSREMKDAGFTALAVSPDGGRLACGTATGVLLWELQEDGPPREFPVTEAVNALLFAPDGLLVSTYANEVSLLEMSEGKRLRGFPTAEWVVPQLELSPDGSRLLVGLFDEGWRLFDYAGAETLQQQGRGNGRVQAASFGPDGQTLLVALKGEGFGVIGTDGKPLVARSTDHLLGSTAMEISPDGGTFASADYGGRLLLRRVSDASTVWSLQVGDASLFRVTFSPDGATLAVFAADGRLSLVNAASGEVLRVINLNAISSCINFSPDGLHLLVPTREGPIHLVDPRTGVTTRQLKLENGQGVISAEFDPNRERIWLMDPMLNQWAWDYAGDNPPVTTGRINLGKSLSVWGTAISPDGGLLVMALSDGSVAGWELEPVSLRFNIKVGTGPIISCRFGAGPGFVVCGDGDGMLNYIDTREGSVVLRHRAHRAAVACTAVSPAGRDIITASVDGEFRAWEAHPALAPEQYRLGASVLGRVAIAPDGVLAAAVTDSGLVRLFEVDGGAVVAETSVLPDYITDLAFSQDGRLLAIAHSGGSVALWETGDGRALREIAVHDDVQAVAFDKSGRLLLTGWYYGLQLRDASSGELLLQHRDTLDRPSLQMFPDGRRVLLSGGDAEPLILELESGKVLARLERNASYSRAGAVSPDGTVVAMMRDRGLIGIYDAESGERLRTLKVRSDSITDLQFFADGRRLFYLAETDGAAVVDLATGRELAGTWFGFGFANGGALAPDGSTALVTSYGGEVEVWRLAPALARLHELQQFDLETLAAIAQVQAGLKLDGLVPMTLPRRTGEITWLTEDGQPPAFLRGPLPDWVPRLEGAEVERARRYVRQGTAARDARILDAARAWRDGFEGYRYREELDTDLSVLRIPIPPRERDADGRWLGEPQGKVDLAAWVRARRERHANGREERIRLFARRGADAAAASNWRLAAAWYRLALEIDEGHPELLIAYARAGLQAGESWDANWRLSQHIERGAPRQRAEMRLLWARGLAHGWNYQQMLEQFDAARNEGYRAEDWHVYRVEAMETFGAYLDAIQAAAAAMSAIRHPVLRARLAAARSRCTLWAAVQKTRDDLPRVIVTRVPAGSNAEKAGLRAGDLVVGFNLQNPDSFTGYGEDESGLRMAWEKFVTLAEPARQNAVFVVLRGGEEIELVYPRAKLDAGLFGLKTRPE